jgi:hypothetical protein
VAILNPSTSRRTGLASLRTGRVPGWAALIVLLAFVRPIDMRAQRSLEYEVKAAFLFNFVQFVEWPAESLPAGEPFRLCLAVENPFAGVLERTVAGEQAAAHPIGVELLPADAPPAKCQVLFVPRSQASRTAAILRNVGTLPVLTVGESPRFIESGGLVNFVVEGGHVRFDVNPEAAAARGLRISSKLLRVARTTGTSERRDW